MRLHTVFSIIALGALSPARLSAADFPRTSLLSIGFEEVRLDDLRSSPEFTERAGSTSGYLSVSTDLNGDGRPDEVRILQNRVRMIAYVVAVIVSPNKVDTFVLGDLPLSQISYTGIVAAKPEAGIEHRRPSSGLAIFDLRDGKGEASYFDGEEFSIRRPFVLGN